MKLIALLTFMTLAFSAPLEAKKLEVIKDHSKINFDINYMLMTTVDGHFKDYKGEFEMNEAETEITKIKIQVQAKSVDTSDKKRDFHLKGHEFFYAAKHPLITFEANGPIKLELNKDIQVDGFLSMRGEKRPLTLVGQYKGKHKDPWNKENYFFELKGALDRKSYGIEWNKVMDNGGVLIADKVNITIAVQAQIKGEKTPFSTHMVPETKGIKERKQLQKGEIDELSTSTKDNKVKVD